jgi:hypothetical protein
MPQTDAQDGYRVGAQEVEGEADILDLELQVSRVATGSMASLAEGAYAERQAIEGSLRMGYLAGLDREIG